MMWRGAVILAFSIAGCGAVTGPERSPDGIWLRDDGNAT